MPLWTPIFALGWETVRGHDLCGLLFPQWVGLQTVPHQPCCRCPSVLLSLRAMRGHWPLCLSVKTAFYRAACPSSMLGDKQRQMGLALFFTIVKSTSATEKMNARWIYSSVIRVSDISGFLKKKNFANFKMMAVLLKLNILCKRLLKPFQDLSESQEVFKAPTWCCKNNSKSRKRSY